MPFLLHKLTRLQIIAVSFLLLIAMTGLATTRRWLTSQNSNRATATAAAGAVPALAAQAKQTAPKLEVELVALHPTGFDPVTITRPKGPFLLVIQNRSGLNELSFQFDKEVGTKLKAVKVPAKKASWSDVVDLNPGTYVMTEITNPKWSLEVVITPPGK